MLFNILSRESKKQGTLVLELTDSLFKPLSLKDIQKGDKRILSKLILIKETSYFTATPKDTIAILRDIAALGALYIDKSKVVADFFSKVQLQYRATFQENSVLIEAFVIMGKEIPFASLDLVLLSTPALFFKNNFLKVFDQDLDNSWIKRALKDNGTIKVERSVFTKWVTEADELPECSPIIIQSNAPEVKPQFLVTPVIVLREQRGVFIDFLIEDRGTQINYFDLLEPLAQEIKEYEKDLTESGYIKRSSENCFYCPSDTALDAVELLLSVGWRVLDKSKKEVRLLSDASLEFRLVDEKIFVEEKSSYQALEPAIKGKHLIPFQDGTYGLLPKEFMAKCASLAQDLEEEEGKFFIPKYKSGALIGNDLFKGPMPNFLQEVKTRLLQQEKNTPLQKNGFQGTLRPYQEVGASWLRSLYDLGFHGILADEMGLGKTVQVLAMLCTIEKKKNSPHLIVMPKSLLFNWKKEFERFLPGYKVWIHTGQERTKNPAKLLEYDAILTSYPLLRQDIDLFKAIDFHAIVLDEAHLIKNANTKSSGAARELSSTFRLSITGTPLENSIEDLVSQFGFLMPGLITSSSDSDAVKSLRKKIRPFLLRRKKEEVAKDLPELINQTVFIEMDEQEKEGYHTLLSKLRDSTLKQLKTEGFAKTRFQVFEAILRLRQYACHPKLCTDYTQSSKLDLLLEEVEEAICSGSKALVFSQFTSMLDLIETGITSLNLPFVRLDGKTKNREEVVRHFQEENTPQVFLISLKAGGVGLNLEKADYVFIYEPWWNESVEEQAIARAHRIGRTHPVIAKRYIVSGTIEEKILELKERKQKLASALIDDSDTPATLSVEDIEFLFSE